MKLQYRADIDGLRAIAVLAVMFYHFGIPGFTGGFVGVDIFFVISGFLITSILQKEINEGRFSIARFYERRIRRIFPALYPVLLFCFIGGAYLFRVHAFMELAQSVAATALFLSNELFRYKSSDYFGSPSAKWPLLHTWSLAVEEQFYIVFPLFLFAINKYIKKHYLYWICASAIISFVASVYGVYISKTATFYLAPTRAWEFLVGTILALQVFPLIKNHVLKNLLGVLGIALLVSSIFYFNEKTLFPGLTAILPVLGASLIIYSGQGGDERIGRFLSLKPFVFTGLISYSLYLWHWPLFVFMKYYLVRDLNSLEIVGLIVLTFIASILSWQFVEKPFRVKPSLLSDRPSLFVVSGILMAVAVIAGSFVQVKKGLPERFLDTPILYAMEKDTLYNSINIKHVNPIWLGLSNKSPSVLLWGDSHAQALTVALSSVLSRNGKSGYVISGGSCPPVFIGNKENKGWTEQEYNDIIYYISSHQELKTIILAAGWSSYSKSQGFKIQMQKTVNTLLNLKRKVVLVADVPEMKYDIPHAIFIAYRTNRQLNDILPDPISDLLPTHTQYLEQNKENLTIFKKLLANQNVTIVYPGSIIFENGHFNVLKNNKLLYIDCSHLSSYGSLYVASVFNL